MNQASRSAAIITLTSDFGGLNHYVAQLKGVILSICPEARIVDATHQVAPQNVLQGAWLLPQVSATFPPDTCHVAVVDPGVGTARSILLIRANQQFFIAPDNGLLTCVCQRWPPEWVRQVANHEYWSNTVSATFHGRDIMAPVAAHLANGVSPSEIGPLLPTPALELDLPKADRHSDHVDGVILAVDAFGNLLTNIPIAELPEATSDCVIELTSGRQPVQIHGITQTYADCSAGSRVALVGSNGQLEIAVVNGHAERILGASPGDPVRIWWPGGGPA